MGEGAFAPLKLPGRGPGAPMPGGGRGWSWGRAWGYGRNSEGLKKWDGGHRAVGVG